MFKFSWKVHIDNMYVCREDKKKGPASLEDIEEISSIYFIYWRSKLKQTKRK